MVIIAATVSMAATRKLQGEIDRCLKKVSEGVETFEDIWQKVHNATNTNQKEKYETDLKKEIKKLQRLRDQIKSWIASGEIKDKSTLVDTRKLIETQMERFKVVERETKTKAYSKEGLGATQKLDPTTREREDLNIWLVNTIDAMQLQMDQFECEIESIMAAKKKKLDKDKQDRLDELKNFMERHKFHMGKLETLMRMLDNLSAEVNVVKLREFLNQVKKIKDDIEYYLESSQEPEFEENEFLYDDIEGLEEQQALGNLALTGADLDGLTSAPTSTNASPSPIHSSPVADGSVRPDSPLDDSDSPSANIKMRTKSTSSNKTEDESIPPIKLARPVAIKNQIQPPPSPVKRIIEQQQDLTPNNSSPSSGQSTNHVSCLSSLSSSPVVSTIPAPITGYSNALSNSIKSHQQQLQQHQNQHQNQVVEVVQEQRPEPESPSPVKLVSMVQQQVPPIVDPSLSYNGLSGGSAHEIEEEEIDYNHQQQHQINNVVETNITTQPQPPLSQPCVENGDSSPQSPVNINHSTTTILNQYGLNTNPNPNPNQNGEHEYYRIQHEKLLLNRYLEQTNEGQQELATLKTMAQDVVDREGLLLIENDITTSTITTEAHIPPLLGVAPLGPYPLQKEHQVQLQMLEVASYHMPVPADSERMRQYLPRNPIPTPGYYPQHPLANTDSLDFFQRLSIETLFFIFYYLEGSKAQYLAAKVLKKQSWRFHTKYMMWFQRHEEPKVINEEYEQGTYIYFDIEKWGQRKKDGFVFEYRYLEDRDLS